MGFVARTGPPRKGDTLGEQALHFADYEGFERHVRDNLPATYELFQWQLMDVYLGAHGVGL